MGKEECVSHMALVSLDEGEKAQQEQQSNMRWSKLHTGGKAQQEQQSNVTDTHLLLLCLSTIIQPLPTHI